MKRRLPIGIQDFVKIREGDYKYVDKTAQIHRLITSGEGAFFLSRPRRFGKSLLCSTLAAIFEGRRELFGGLAIDSLEWEWKKHPVIRIDLNPGNYSEGTAVLDATLHDVLENAALNLGLNLRGQLAFSQLGNLIMDAHRKYGERVAVIIDEYDKPLVSTLDAGELHLEMRKALKGFYGSLKSADAHLKFVFLTGVSKFSKVSVFSDLNHLADLSLDSRYADLCGITQEELEQSFEPEIENVLQSAGKSREAYLVELRRFYNGYRFSENPIKVYNSFGLLNHFASDGKFLSYWYETGTPTFLINLIIEQRINIVDLCNLYVRLDDFHKYDIDNMEAVPLLYQTGYLTVSDYNEERSRFALGYPNEEVRASFAKSLIRQYMRVPMEKSRPLSNKLIDALYDGDVDGAMEAVRAFLASIPYDIIGERENYYQTAVHLIFTMLGFNCRSEVRIAHGRVDTMVETKSFVYCFEFKLDGTADEALAQIDTKEYLLPWTTSGKKLFKIGVSFDPEKRNVGEWKFLVFTE